MARTISGTNGYISLNPATDNPTYVTGTISTSSDNVALLAPSGAAWTVTNTGSIRNANTGGSSSGIRFQSASALFINGRAAAAAVMLARAGSACGSAAARG